MRTLALAALLLVPASALASYDSGGRRDPFVLAVAHAGESPAWDEVRPTALLTTRDGARALLVGGPAAEGVFVRPGDALGEATVRAIDVERGLVVLDVPDPRAPRGSHQVALRLR